MDAPHKAGLATLSTTKGDPGRAQGEVLNGLDQLGALLDIAMQEVSNLEQEADPILSHNDTASPSEARIDMPIQSRVGEIVQARIEQAEMLNRRIVELRGRIQL